MGHDFIHPYKAKKIRQDAFANKLNMVDARSEVFRIVKQLDSKNKDITGDQCVMDDHGIVNVYQSINQ